ncbi:MAG: hypothetical protein CO144_00175 [Candidatus Nealsonbacteria bacterium CG_4_9_14_3_um_filter_35_11]|uniref:Bacterial type II secretion system protein E domain-containing protein n=2 Tax=Candidatus Nealsoniibacteriota TaxID=1817911 RepID=A0A2M7DAF8_9BACT|nr:MAG: hypothetical protein COV62_02615 [Candidatus Nealsonbacteria bacterium CG11_big_fil_rev_8_21_14_0_20_35_11]PIV45448.1 MAG: hypothetical protein COS24_02285 [Candidatus Nealsonbacteria bacterium CG02_land_8_20_14_3_00_34_20]PIW92600.1 MAG: hypothetical protein COZ88_01265 [Candidatus Nealsonbacteria bacterium CG_4_8_14_3_um_filter_34_13]PIZ89928.1 MAG: hypothetical protein COX88_01330 [Candidatus Nealsonbacteria bacterium CG_4_10_14_0_2_um_filter_35_20]PJA84850.1 MAG: hypothetical protei
MSLIQKLVEKGKIDQKTANSLKEKLGTSNETEENFLLDQKIIGQDYLFSLKSEILNVPLRKDAETLEIPNEILALIPEESARYYKIIPLSLKENILEIGMVDPEDIKAREVLLFVARQHRISYKISLITLDAFEILSKQYRNLREEVGAALEALETELGKGEGVELAVSEKPSIERLAEEAPIIKMVAVILRHAVEGKASDIHIEPTTKKLRVRFRMDGILYSSLFLPLAVHPSIVARVKILSNLRIDETRIPQDGRFTAKIGEKEVDFRVSTFPIKLGEKVAIRVLDPTEGLKSYKELGLTGRNMDILKEAAKNPYGMILATGPTGSGKTTTLYALLQILNKEEVNIVTLEDPIEYFMGGVNQSQIRPEIGYDFPQGLRHIVRQDPDIIMVGEIRDEESAALAIHSALTGHVVLSTLHTNNAVGVIPRLIDMQIKPFLIPPALNIAIAQRLARVLCPYCKEKVKPKKAMKEIILKELESLPGEVTKKLKIPDPFYLYEAKGCKKCNFKGVKGRIGIFETLKMTDQLAEIILKEPSELKITQEAERQGMATMRQDAILKALEGLISMEEVMRVSEE